MVVSMTGFGRGVYEAEGFQIHAEIRTVNHRFSEFHIRMPRQLLMLEDKIKKQLTPYIRRGRAEVFISLDGKALIEKKLDVDWDLLDQYMGIMERISDKYGLHPTSSPEDASKWEGVLSIKEVHAFPPELEKGILAAVNMAGEQLKGMREAEGKLLNEDIRKQLVSLSEAAEEVKKHAPSVIHQYKERLQQRMQEFSAGVIDETRITSEVAVFADKVDINEELTRLNSHITQVDAALKSGNTIGRKLDFLVQEMNREVNTIGAKANDSRIAAQVVEMKSLLEKMKEQVQNIE